MRYKFNIVELIVAFVFGFLLGLTVVTSFAAVKAVWLEPKFSSPSSKTQGRKNIAAPAIFETNAGETNTSHPTMRASIVSLASLSKLLHNLNLERVRQ